MPDISHKCPDGDALQFGRNPAGWQLSRTLEHGRERAHPAFGKIAAEITNQLGKIRPHHDTQTRAAGRRRTCDQLPKPDLGEVGIIAQLKDRKSNCGKRVARLRRRE